MLSIVIRTYNEAAHLGRLLDGIRQQTIQDVQAILVDSGSTDDTLRIARSYPLQIVQIHPAEFTFGRSLNRGLTQAQGDIAVIASAHVYPVYPDWLERLVAPFADPQVGLTYGKQRGAPASYFSEHQIFAHWFPEVSQLDQAHPFCNNANAAIRCAMWRAHPYDETLTGLEDLAWARHIQHSGRRLAYVAEAEVIHVHHETPHGVYNRYRREAMAFKSMFAKEHFGLLDFMHLSWGNIASDLWHAAHQQALSQHWRSIIWFRLAQFWGAYQGYRHPGPVTDQLRQTFYYPRSFSPGDASQKRAVEPIQYVD